MSGETLAKIIVADLGLPTSYELDITNQVKNVLSNMKRSSIGQKNSQGMYYGSQVKEDIYKEKPEKLCTIILDITRESIRFEDKFEWDIYNQSNDSAEFSRILVKDLGLPKMFERLINFQIQKQVRIINI